MFFDTGGFDPSPIYTLEQLKRNTQRLVEQNKKIMYQAGYAIDLRQYPVRYRVEPRGINLFQNVKDIIASGVADCEDFASWLKAYYDVLGIPSTIVFEKQSPTLYHVTNRVFRNGRMTKEDPSRWFGMGGGF